MKYLDYLGKMYYNRYVDFLGNVHIEKQAAHIGFLYGTEGVENLKKNKDQKVIVMGTGPNSNYCTNLLKASGVDIDCYCDNDFQLLGQELFGKKIMSPLEAFKDPKAHVVVAIEGANIDAVYDQMLHNHFENYSFFFHNNSSINFDDPKKREVIMAALNCLINVEREPRQNPLRCPWFSAPPTSAR